MAKTKSYISFFVILLLNTGAQATTLDSYLKQVEEKDPAYKASVDSTQGASMRSREGDLLVLPKFEAQFSHGEDKTPLQPTLFYGTERDTSVYQFDIAEQTRFGLNAKLGYGSNYFSTLGQSFSSFPAYYQNSPSISLTQSLWRNGFGSETRALEAMTNAKAKETYYLNRTKNINVITDAQSTYYRLFYAKKTVKAVQASLDVANKLLEWTKSQLKKGLGEKSDYLQTKANYELRQLDLSASEEEVRSAARAFNSLRGIDHDSVTEELADPGIPEYKGEQKFSDSKWRDDVRAAQKNLEGAKANSLLGKEKNKPQLDLLGSYGWNAIQATEPQAVTNSFHDTYPSWMVGLKFSTPLWLGTASDVRDGYEKEAFASDLEFRRKAEEQERDFNDLQSKIKNTYTRFNLSKTIEESQKEKVEEERRRHHRGRTTFFQLLQFEQDYLNSELARIKTENELTGYLVQLQKYREE